MTRHETPEDVELAVLAAMARGSSKRAVAAELRLGHRSIDKHLSNVCARLDVAYPIEAVVWAVRHGLI